MNETLVEIIVLALALIGTWIKSWLDGKQIKKALFNDEKEITAIEKRLDALEAKTQK